MTGMKIILAIGIAGLLFLQVTGLDLVVAPEACTTTCPTDGPDGSCAPLCPDCFCCPTLRSCIQPDHGFSSPLASTMAPRTERKPLPLSAHPVDIFHIPKAALA